MGFAPAERKNAKLRAALDGPAGSGKSFTMLQMLKLFDVNPGVIESERGSALKYAHKKGTVEGPGNWQFQCSQLEAKKNPDAYMVELAEAARRGFSAIGIDSYSHSWLGALEDVDAISGSGSKFTSGWKKVSPKVSKLVDAILNYPGHVICTMRDKTEYVLEENAKGKKEPRKVGTAPVAREGTDYEFDVMLNLSLDGMITVAKSRAHGVIAAGDVFTREQIPELVAKLKEWLDLGAPLSPVEEFTKRIKFCTSQEDLDALRPALTALSLEDRKILKPIYEARKQELADAETDLGGGEVP